MKEINDVLLDKLLAMARLELSKEGREEMKEELNKMAEWLQKLGEVDTDKVVPLTTMAREVNRLREDIAEGPLATEQLLSNAPDRSSHYFRTPVVVADE